MDKPVIYSILIKDIGLVKIEGTRDIDSAYMNAVEKYNCKIEDIWCVGPIQTNFPRE